MTKNRPVPPRSGWISSLITGQRGSALVEELVTVAVIGLGLSILVAMITTGAVGVRMIDDRSTAEILARSQLELIADAPYQADPLVNPYPTPAAVPGYTVSVSIRYWNSASSSFTTSTVNDGLQEISVTVSDSDGPLYTLSGYKTER